MNESFSLSEFANLARQNTKGIYVCFIAPLVLAIILSLTTPNQYTTSATLATKRSSSSSSTNGVGLLAAFSGIEDEKLSPELKFASNYFYSYKFLSSFLIQHDLIDDLLMYRGFDSISKKNILKNNSSQYEVMNLLSEENPLQGLKEVQKATKELRKHIKYFASRADPSLAVIEVTHYSPSFSFFLATELIEKLDSDIAAIDRASSQNQISYINSSLQDEASIETSKILSSILTREYTKKILASSSDQYAFSLLDPPVYPVEKSEPRRSIFILISLMTGLILSITFLTIHVLNAQRSIENSK